MIMYGVFLLLSMIGLGFFIYGFYKEIELFNFINPYLGVQGYLPESLGFFLISWIFMFIAIIGIMYRIKSSGCGKRFDKIPKNQSVFDFIYRDGTSMDMIGNRRVGMGIFDIKDLGVIVDIGRKPSPGSVYRFGDKNIRFALQDINFTPNVKFTSIYTFFSSLGINNADELHNVLSGYDAALMVKVWNKLCEYTPLDATDRFVQNIQEMNPEEIKRNNRAWKHNEIEGLIDKIKTRREQ